MNYYMYHGGNHYDRTAAGGLTEHVRERSELPQQTDCPTNPRSTHLQTGCTIALAQCQRRARVPSGAVQERV